MSEAHVFISYVRNNRRLVQRLCDDLTKHGVKVWLDRKDIEPGVDWRQAIRKAIEGGAFFIACFSKQYEARRMEKQGRGKTYMNTELMLAIDELRKRFPDQSWFIPVKLNRCEIPDIDIGAGKTLRDLQYVELYKDWDDGVSKLLDVIHPIPPNVRRLVEALHSESYRVRMHAISAIVETRHNIAAIPALIEVLSVENAEAENPMVRLRIVRALGEIGHPAAITPLLQTIYDRDIESSIRVYAVSALCKIGEPAVPDLIKLLNHELAIIRAEAANALKDIGTSEALEAVAEYSKQWGIE